MKPSKNIPGEKWAIQVELIEDLPGDEIISAISRRFYPRLCLRTTSDEHRQRLRRLASSSWRWRHNRCSLESTVLHWISAYEYLADRTETTTDSVDSRLFTTVIIIVGSSSIYASLDDSRSCSAGLKTSRITNGVTWEREHRWWLNQLFTRFYWYHKDGMLNARTLTASMNWQCRKDATYARLKRGC